MKDFTEAELQRFPEISQQNLSKAQVRSNPVLYKALSLFRRSQNSKEYISRRKLASDAEKEKLKSELEKKSKELMAEKGRHQAELENLTILKEDSLKVDISLGGGPSPTKPKTHLAHHKSRGKSDESTIKKSRISRACTLPVMHVQTLLKSFHSRKLIIHPSELITVEFEPVRGHINWAQLESSGISDSTKGLLMHLFPAGSVKLVRTVLKHYQLGTFLEQVRRASQSVNLAQWGDNTSAESNSRTFYSGPAYFVENMLKEQTRQLLQTCAEDCSLDRNVMLAKLETAYEDLQASFVNWDALEHANNTGEKKWDFSLFAFFYRNGLELEVGH